MKEFFIFALWYQIANYQMESIYENKAWNYL